MKFEQLFFYYRISSTRFYRDTIQASIIQYGIDENNECKKEKQNGKIELVNVFLFNSI